MMRALVLAVLATACRSESLPADEPVETPAASRGSAGGFSASLHAELAGSSAAAVPERTAASATGTPAGSGSGDDRGSPASSAASAGSAVPAGAASTGSNARTATANESGSAGTATSSSAGSASGSARAPSGSAAATPAGATGGSATSASGSAAAKPASTPAPAAPKPVATSAELQAIKLSLLPNWDRDAGEAGTFSLFVRVQSRDESALFKFHYGYDDPRAPASRDDYKKFLTDSKILAVAADRQRGAAWYLEGTDATGHPAFRMLVIYGGKRLVCYGSLYKDSGLGDIRDEVVIQAKKICETIQL